MTLLERVYPRLPVGLQNAACTWYGWREGRERYSKEFDDALSFLQLSERWSADRIRRYKDERVRRTVQSAFESVPYYRDGWSRLGIHPSDIRGVQDLHLLPLLTKDEVRANSRALRSTRIPGWRMRVARTSGTTGTSLEVARTRGAIAYQWAVWWRHRMRFGCSPGEWHVTFTGKPVAPPEQSRPPYWRSNRTQRQHLVNMHHVTPEKIADIVGFLNRVDVRFYSGYPSILAEVARLALEASLPLEPSARPRYIFLGAEPVLDTQRALLEEWTGAHITDQYGTAEGCGNASRCEYGVYHEDFEFGHLEVVDGETLEDGSIRGEVACTGFTNPAMPLVRYLIGDVVVELPPSECPCGRRSRRLGRVEGRSEDYVVTPEGRRIMRFDYIFKEAAAIREAQVVQHRLGAIEVRIVPGDGFCDDDAARLRSEVHRWISPRLEVAVTTVSRIPREANGKFRPVRSLLPAASHR